MLTSVSALTPVKTFEMFLTCRRFHRHTFLLDSHKQHEQRFMILVGLCFKWFMVL